MAEFTARWNELQKKLVEVQKNEPIPFDLKSLPFIDRYDTSKETLQELIELAKNVSPVANTISKPTPINVSLA